MAVQLNVHSIFVSCTTVFNCSLGCVDVERGYLQSDTAKRKIRVQLPSEIGRFNVLRMWRKLLYRFSETGIQ